MNDRKRLESAEKIVVKVGTSTLTYPNGKLNLKRIERLAWVLSDIENSGKKVVLVSSGAIGVGSERLGFKARPSLTKEKQAAAAVGQAALMQIYQNFFNEYGQRIAQVLVTKEDMEDIHQRKNAYNTFETLFGFEVIPIVNANDTTSTAETELDNDSLSSTVASLTEADLLVLLTDIDALYTSDPKKNPDAVRISLVERLTTEIEGMGEDKGSEFGLGGMVTKLAAAKICERSNIDMIIADGSDPSVLNRILAGEDIGTLFAFKK